MTLIQIELPLEGLSKICIDCKELKQEDEYYYRHDYNRRLTYCKKCAVERDRRWRQKNPGRKRAADLKRNYNITADQYDALLEQQGGLCAICGEISTCGRYLSVDHNHECCPDPGKSCGKCIRGLLCDICNRVLGFFRDDSELFKKAVAYLEKGCLTL